MKKYLIIAVTVIVGAFGIYAGLRYRNDVYIPEKELQEDSKNLAEQIERIRPDIDFDADVPVVGADVPVVDADVSAVAFRIFRDSIQLYMDIISQKWKCSLRFSHSRSVSF